MPEISQEVVPTLTRLARPLAATVLEPVVVVPARVRVSVVMATVCVDALLLCSTITVPIGNATEAFAGMVQPPLVFATLFAESVKANVMPAP